MDGGKGAGPTIPRKRQKSCCLNHPAAAMQEEAGFGRIITNTDLKIAKLV